MMRPHSADVLDYSYGSWSRRPMHFGLLSAPTPPTYEDLVNDTTPPSLGIALPRRQRWRQAKSRLRRAGSDEVSAEPIGLDKPTVWRGLAPLSPFFRMPVTARVTSRSISTIAS